MGSPSAGDAIDSSEPAGSADSCPLPPGLQTRNLLLYSINTGLIYLASPVLYVGIVHAPLCKKLGADNTVANLPATMQFAAAAVPILVAWWFPFAWALKRIVIVSFAVTAAMVALVAAVLLAPVPSWVKIAVVVAQGAVTGGALFTGVACMWEVLGRAVAPSRRGLTLSLAFGVGPVLAMLASLGSQLLLDGKLGALEMEELEYPWNYVTLIAAAVPIMALAAFLATQFILPLPGEEVTRLPFGKGVFGGLGDFLGNRALLLTAIIAVLVYGASQITSNMAIYAKDVIGEGLDRSEGYQNALRFGFKCVAGLLLGWVLTKTHPQAGVLITALFVLGAVVWALTVTGPWYLICFGLFGAGELFGVYAPNYILSCSAPAKMRRNMGFAAMLMVPAAPAGILFGGIADYFGEAYQSQDLGFKLSFLAALAFVGSAILLTLWLPARPKPEKNGVPDNVHGK